MARTLPLRLLFFFGPASSDTHTHTHTHTYTHHRTPTEEPVAENSTWRQHSQETATAPAGFKPTISAGERPQTHASDRAATKIGPSCTFLYLTRDIFMWMSEMTAFESLTRFGLVAYTDLLQASFPTTTRLISEASVNNNEIITWVILLFENTNESTFKTWHIACSRKTNLCDLIPRHRVFASVIGFNRWVRQFRSFPSISSAPDVVQTSALSQHHYIEHAHFTNSFSVRMHSNKDIWNSSLHSPSFNTDERNLQKLWSEMSSITQRSSDCKNSELNYHFPKYQQHCYNLICSICFYTSQPISGPRVLPLWSF